MKFYLTTIFAIYLFGPICEGFVYPSVTDLSQKRSTSSNILSSQSQYLSSLGSSGDSEAKSFTDVKTQYYSLGSPIAPGNYETGSSKVALPNKEQKPVRVLFFSYTLFRTERCCKIKIQFFVNVSHASCVRLF